VQPMGCRSRGSAAVYIGRSAVEFPLAVQAILGAAKASFSFDQAEFGSLRFCLSAAAQSRDRTRFRMRGYRLPPSYCAIRANASGCSFFTKCSLAKNDGPAPSVIPEELPQ